MNRERFERIVTQSRFKPLRRIPTPHGAILIAESFRRLDIEYMEPHWQMIWAIDRDGMDIARKIFCHADSTRQDRVAATMKDAMQFIADGVTAGRYE